MIPALFTRMCSGPVHRSTNCATDRWSDNSSGCTKIASLPVLRTSSAATWSPAAVRRTARVTSAPVEARARAVSTPIPDEPPVTIARRPERSMPSITSSAVEEKSNGVRMLVAMLVVPFCVEWVW
jgi:hypothetical protein